MANNRYTIHFSGIVIETTVTNKASDVDRWFGEIWSIYNVPQRIIVGLDCEWKPNYVKGFVNRTATLQLCINKKCLIIQLIHLDRFPNSLRAFCCDRNVLFVGAGVEDDIMKLGNDYQLRCGLRIDIQEMVMEGGRLSLFYPEYRGKQRPSLKTLAWELTGMEMEKPSPVSRSNWDASVLTLEQIRYAAIDAYASWRVGCKLLNGY